MMGVFIPGQFLGKMLKKIYKKEPRVIFGMI